MLVLDEQTDGNVMLDLLLLNKEELLWCHLTAISWGGCSRSWGKWESQVIITQNFKLVDFGLFNELAGKNLLPWKAETHESCLIFKDSLKAQEQSILMFRILSRYSRRPAWLNRELLPDFRCKKREKSVELEAGTSNQRKIQKCFLGVQQGSCSWNRNAPCPGMGEPSQNLGRSGNLVGHHIQCASAMWLLQKWKLIACCFAWTGLTVLFYVHPLRWQWSTGVLWPVWDW